MLKRCKKEKLPEDLQKKLISRALWNRAKDLCRRSYRATTYVEEYAALDRQEGYEPFSKLEARNTLTVLATKIAKEDAALLMVFVISGGVRATAREMGMSRSKVSMRLCGIRQEMKEILEAEA